MPGNVRVEGLEEHFDYSDVLCICENVLTVLEL